MWGGANHRGQAGTGATRRVAIPTVQRSERILSGKGIIPALIGCSDSVLLALMCHNHLPWTLAGLLSRTRTRVPHGGTSALCASLSAFLVHFHVLVRLHPLARTAGSAKTRLTRCPICHPPRHQGVDTSTTDTKGTVLIKSAEELENYSK